LASSHHISIEADVIDADFRGNLSALLFNHSKYPYNLPRGDKLATLICEKLYYPELDLVRDWKTPLCVVQEDSDPRV